MDEGDSAQPRRPGKRRKSTPADEETGGIVSAFARAAAAPVQPRGVRWRPMRGEDGRIDLVADGGVVPADFWMAGGGGGSASAPAAALPDGSGTSARVTASWRRWLRGAVDCSIAERAHMQASAAARGWSWRRGADEVDSVTIAAHASSPAADAFLRLVATSGESAYSTHMRHMLTTVVAASATSGLLAPHERALAAALLTLSPAAAGLLSRLFSRRGPWFRSMTMRRYPELLLPRADGRRHAPSAAALPTSPRPDGSLPFTITEDVPDSVLQVVLGECIAADALVPLPQRASPAAAASPGITSPSVAGVKRARSAFSSSAGAAAAATPAQLPREVVLALEAIICVGTVSEIRDILAYVSGGGSAATASPVGGVGGITLASPAIRGAVGGVKRSPATPGSGRASTPMPSPGAGTRSALLDALVHRVRTQRTIAGSHLPVVRALHTILDRHAAIVGAVDGGGGGGAGGHPSRFHHLVRIAPGVIRLLRRAHGLYYLVTATAHLSSGMGTGSWPIVLAEVAHEVASEADGSESAASPASPAHPLPAGGSADSSLDALVMAALGSGAPIAPSGSPAIKRIRSDGDTAVASSERAQGANANPSTPPLQRSGGGISRTGSSHGTAKRGQSSMWGTGSGSKYSDPAAGLDSFLPPGAGAGAGVATGAATGGTKGGAEVIATLYGSSSPLAGLYVGGAALFSPALLCAFRKLDFARVHVDVAQTVAEVVPSLQHLRMLEALHVMRLQADSTAVFAAPPQPPSPRPRSLAASPSPSAIGGPGGGSGGGDEDIILIEDGDDDHDAMGGSSGSTAADVVIVDSQGDAAGAAAAADSSCSGDDAAAPADDVSGWMWYGDGGASAGEDAASVDCLALSRMRALLQVAGGAAPPASPAALASTATAEDWGSWHAEAVATAPGAARYPPPLAGWQLLPFALLLASCASPEATARLCGTVVSAPASPPPTMEALLAVMCAAAAQCTPPVVPSAAGAVVGGHALCALLTALRPFCSAGAAAPRLSPPDSDEYLRWLLADGCRALRLLASSLAALPPLALRTALVASLALSLSQAWESAAAAVAGSQPLFSHAWLHQLSPASLSSTLLWEAIDPLERGKCYAHTIPLLAQLVLAPFTPHRAGRWWTRLSLNLQHLGLPCDAWHAATIGFCDGEALGVRGGDRLELYTRATRMRPRSLTPAPLGRWPSPSMADAVVTVDADDDDGDGEVVAGPVESAWDSECDRDMPLLRTLRAAAPAAALQPRSLRVDGFVRQPLTNATGLKSRFLADIDVDNDFGTAGGEAGAPEAPPATPPRDTTRWLRASDIWTPAKEGAALSAGNSSDAGDGGEAMPAHSSSAGRFLNITDEVCATFGWHYQREGDASQYRATPLPLPPPPPRGSSSSSSSPSVADGRVAERGPGATAPPPDVDAGVGGDEEREDDDAEELPAAAVAPLPLLPVPQGRGGAVGRDALQREREFDDDLADWDRRHSLRVGVEELALGFYHAECGGWRGVHCEGGPVYSIVALLMFDVLFADGVPPTSSAAAAADTSSAAPAFITPWQDAPLDLDSPGVFYRRRRSAIRDTLLAIVACDDAALRGRLSSAWTRHYGQACRGLRWATYPLQLLQLIATGLGAPTCAALCDAVCFDHKHLSGGAPDLLLWRVVLPAPAARVGGLDGGGAADAVAVTAEMGSLPALPHRDADLVLPAGAIVQVRLSEVKGPRDELSEKQHVWLRILLAAGARAAVCKIVEPAAGSGGSKAPRRHGGTTAGADIVIDVVTGGSADGAATRTSEKLERARAAIRVRYVGDAGRLLV